jgi:hypothetical protein
VRGLEEMLDKDSLLPILFNLYSEYLTKEASEGFGDFKREGQAIHNLKYADDLVLLVKEEAVLQGMTERIKAFRGCYRI